MKPKFYCVKAPPSSRAKAKGRLLSLLLLVLLTLKVSSAQDLIVNGTVNNAGKIRVKKQTIISQANVGGEIILTGADQTLPAKNYQTVNLLGTGTKTASAGNFSIAKNLTIAAAVTLNIPKGNVITLGDTLFENGTLQGAIQKSVNLTGSTTSSNFGSIGATISWSSTAPGVTNVLRASDSLSMGNSHQSAKRFYEITPTVTDATGTITFEFTNAELDSQNIHSLQLWKSTDNGANWRWQGGVVDTLLRSISKSNVALNGRWTFADTLHPLGPLSIPGEPASIMLASVNNPTAQISTPVSAFTIVIKDAFDSPVKNISVSFSITSTPDNAIGQQLSDTSVVTDSLGRAITSLKLGNKVGTYVVKAQAGNLSPIFFTAKAKHGPASTMTIAQGNSQLKPILTQLDSLFTISVVDAGENIVDSATVQFTIITTPLNAAGQMLSTTSAVTDSSGTASTKLTLGNKVGTYVVTASVNGISTPLQFTANAVHGAPATISMISGADQSAVNGTTLPNPLKVRTFDIGGNFVPGDTVNFAFTSIPIGATGQNLSDTTVVTDSSGTASTKLTLGNKVGIYVVSAKSKSLSEVLLYNFIAIAGAPSSIMATSGNTQSAQINTVLPNDLVVNIFDANGNAVPASDITFSITSAPQNAVGQSVPTTAKTDSNGSAKIKLTLGNKVGTYEVTARIPSHRTGEVLQVNGKKMRVAATQSPNDITVKFTATALYGTPAALQASSGLNQSEKINTQLKQPFVVNVHDEGENVVPNSIVTFAITSTPLGATGQSLSTTSLPSDSLGAVATVLTLGNKAGTYEVTATVTTRTSSDAVLKNNKGRRTAEATNFNTIQVKFTAIAKPGAAASIAIADGNMQTAQINTRLQDALSVRVVDIGTNAVPEVPVTFVITSAPANASGYSVTTANIISDSMGYANTFVTLGNKVGNYTITASVQGLPIATFKATASPGALKELAQVSGANQSKQILTSLDAPFIMRALDAGGNAIPNTSISFAITSSPLGATGMTLSDSSDISDSSGAMKTTLTLGNKVGVYEVTARIIVPGTSRSEIRMKKTQHTQTSSVIETKFYAVAKPGSPSSVMQLLGNNQTQPTATKLDTPFVVTVHDIGGNPVPYVGVRFAVTSTPANSIGQQVSDTLVATDSLGKASTYLTLGDYNGTYSVTASAEGISPTLFTANAFLVYGDPNNDINVNIADITTLIDHITGAHLLTRVDSIKADLNADGRIDTADVGIMKNRILQIPLLQKASIPFVEPTQVIPSYQALAQYKTANAATATSQLEYTPLGVRLNITNNEPVRGIEVRLHLKDSTINVRAINMLFTRAQAMQTIVVNTNKEVRVLAYNLTNEPINGGTGPVFRLPSITSQSKVDTAQVILAVASNIAVVPPTENVTSSVDQYPTTFLLSQNYPNPFNGTTTINYELPDKEGVLDKVLIHVYNILGQKVKTLVTGAHNPGRYTVTWDGTNENGEHVSSGVYFYRLMAKKYISSKKMLYVK